MYKTFYITLMIILIFFNFSFADTSICDDNRMSNAVFTSCLSEQAETLEEELKKVYQAFLDKHTDDKIYQSKIKASQKMWLKHRKAELEMAFPHASDDKYYWTGLTRCYLQYSNELTIQRIKLLQTLDQTLDKRGCASHKVF